MSPPDLEQASSQQLQQPPKRPRKYYRQFTRRPPIQEARQSLPVYMHEQEIIEAIHDNDVTVVVSTTGSGKTTQVPQFLLEDGFGSRQGFPGMIAVTQPRRIAAISCAKRVAHEISTRIGQVVGYHTRHRTCLEPHTHVKFCTDGILLKEIEADLTLAAYSAVVMDEIHERSLNTDLILALLSRTILLRRRQSPPNPLKVVLMSATIDDAQLFDGLKAIFGSLKVVNVPSRIHPVTVHYSRETPVDYIEAAESKVCKIHRKLPPGAILVFLSGREEVRTLCARLTDELCTEEGDKVVIMPLFSTLPSSQQARVFDTYPKEVRKIIVATNIAETSVTISDVTYIVDSGKCKEVSWMTGLVSTSFLPVEWVSKASAEQRAGRAGRTGPGHCYRLYSSPVFHAFKPSRTPEILRVPVDSLVLRLKAMGVSDVDKFPFITKPSSRACAAALETLRLLGALRPVERGNEKSGFQSITATGLKMAKLPVSPRIARGLLATTGDLELTRYACRLAGILSVGTVWNCVTERRKRASLESKLSDMGTDLRAVCGIEKEYHGTSDSKGEGKQYCEQYGLNYKAVTEALSISAQVEKLLLSGNFDGEPLPSLTQKMEEQLLMRFCRGFGDQVARKVQGVEAGRCEKTRKFRGRVFSLPDGTSCVLDSSSSLKSVQWGSDFVCYVRVEWKSRSALRTFDSIRNGDDDSRGQEEFLVMRGVTFVDKAWVAGLCPSVCQVKAANPSNPLVSYDGEKLSVSILCKQMYRTWTVGEVSVAAGKYYSEASDQDYEEAIREKCLEVFARAILAGRVKIEGQRIELTTSLPKYVAVHRLAATLKQHGSPFSAELLGEEIRREGNFLQAGLNRF
eukprot:GFKZ01008523.1.p1 GENE.GFKZ01008523.1~~GFKZ01008523.1.p1  ORF type:complete len:854 (+),score=101.34 GFKZ01008523.1:265-2826(+)